MDVPLRGQKRSFLVAVRAWNIRAAIAVVALLLRRCGLRINGLRVGGLFVDRLHIRRRRNQRAKHRAANQRADDRPAIAAAMTLTALITAAMRRGLPATVRLPIINITSAARFMSFSVSRLAGFMELILSSDFRNSVGNRRFQ